MFEMTVPWWEIIVRVAVIYIALLVMVRLSGKRNVGQFTPMDLLVVLLIAETVSPALQADDTSIQGGLLAAGTLISLSLLIAIATQQSHRFESLVEGQPSVLVKDGVIQRKVMKREHITDEDLEHALRREGLASLDDVALATVEESGEITVIERGKKPGRASAV